LNRFPAIVRHDCFSWFHGRIAFESSRDFVNAFDKAGELKRITQPVATELEITELSYREIKSPQGGKARLFARAVSDAA